MNKPNSDKLKTTQKKRRVAMVGGGLAGIASAISLLDEGLEVVIFERTSVYGGTWTYRDESEPGIASTMATTSLNHSKEMGALSNFPPKKEYSNHMRHREVHEYLEDIVAAKDIRRHIRTNSTVTSVRRSEDYDKTGQWIVDVRNTLSGELTTDTFDSVAICIGHINRPKMPTFPGQENFTGQILHTHNLKSVDSFKDLRVLVVGMGCSAMDAAVGSSYVAEQVYLSTRSGANVIPRSGPYGYPVDHFLVRRFLNVFLDILPVKFCAWLLKKIILNPHFDEDLYVVKPDHHFLAKDPSVNDHIGSKMMSGAVKQKRQILKFVGDRGVVFEGEEDQVVEVDVVIMATGYSWEFPFLEEGVLSADKASGRIDLYKCMFPVQLKHPTLAFIGFFLPMGPGFPVGELQCRYMARVFSGHCVLPSSDKMLNEATKRYKYNLTRYMPSDKMSLHVDYIPYMDNLAKKIGCKPNLPKLLFTDPKLHFKLVYGPCVAYQYRLKGPHKWDGARKAVFTVNERMDYPLRRINATT